MPDMYTTDGSAATGSTKNGSIVIMSGRSNYQTIDTYVKSDDIADITDDYADRFDDVGYYC